MPRTAEQIAADDAVTKALEEWLRVYQLDGSAPGDGDPRVLTDYVVFMATQGWTSEGDTVTGYPYVLRDMNMPMYRAVGLAQLGLENLASTLTDNDD